LAQCPACGRPVAMVRARCLYCGAALPAEAVAAAEQSAAASSAGPVTRSSTRALLVVDWGADPPASSEAVLDLSPYEAALRRRRGGYRLECVLEAAEAEREAARLRSAGLRVFLVAEAATRALPWVAASGAREGGGLRLRGEGGSRLVAPSDLLLVVRGPIVREYQAKVARRKVDTAGLEGGHRFHLHLKASPSPLELDPGEFDFRESGRLSASSLLELSAWILTLAEGLPVDDGFRWLTPALGPAPPAPGASLAPSALSRTPGRDPKDPSTVLDNLEQFRFYSAWRAAVERLRVGSPPDGGAVLT